MHHVLVASLLLHPADNVKILTAAICFISVQMWSGPNSPGRKGTTGAVAHLRLLVSLRRNRQEPDVRRSALLWPHSRSSSVRVQQKVCQRVYGQARNPNCPVESFHRSRRGLQLHHEVGRRLTVKGSCFVTVVKYSGHFYVTSLL